MPYYADLNPKGELGRVWAADPQARARAVTRLLALRAALADPNVGPPPRSLGNLLIGTWNLREFDSPTWGDRLPESYAYIAEIVDRFDLVAIQEVRERLDALDRLKWRLGENWDYLVSDVTEGRAGNRERLAYLYDRRKVRFLGMAGELVLKPVEAGTATSPAKQLARTPWMAAFQVGWTKFVLTTVHILYGPDAPAPPERVEEIKQVASFLKARSESDSEPIHNFILLGDFNIFSEDDPTAKALADEGFTVAPGFDQIPGTNVDQNKHYDQIVYRTRNERFEPTGGAGTFDYYTVVMTDAESDTYRSYIDDYIEHAGADAPKEPTDADGRLRQFRLWRTYQLSDHLPLWAEFKVDFSDSFLQQTLQ